MKQIINCSRRNDVIQYQYDWLQKCLKEEKVVWNNIYNNKDYTISLKEEDVHSIILWSKNFNNFINDPGLLEKYNLFFQFTINGYPSFLEAGGITVSEASRQLDILSQKYDYEQIMLRFDPIFFGKWSDDSVGERLEAFEILCFLAKRFFIPTITVSFLNMNPRIQKRLENNNIEFYSFSDEYIDSIFRKMILIANKYDIRIKTCCNNLTSDSPVISGSRCVDANDLEKLFGGKLSKAKDNTRRPNCHCHKNRDIGDYSQECHKKCLLCYVNPFQS